MSGKLTAAAASPSGEQIELRCGEQRAVVVSLGAGLREYSVAGIPIIDGYGPGDICDGARGQLLVPWPNRLRDGRYRCGDAELQVPLSEPERGNAIHGLTRWMSWTPEVLSVATAALRLDLPPQPGYPFQLRLDAVYRLSPQGLSLALSALNLGRNAAPYGAGAHPYLSLGAAAVGELRLRVPAASRLVSDEHGIPVGAQPVAGSACDYTVPRVLGDAVLDLAYGDLERDSAGVARITVEAPGTGGATLWLDANHPYVMVFTGDTLEPARRRRSLAVEPMTCAPNAFQSGDGLRMIEPGSRFVSRWGITPRVLSPA